jgi:hypothetical protein
VLPPLGVFLERGCNADFLINILLTVLGYIPVSSPTITRTSHTLLTHPPGHHPRVVHHIQVLADSQTQRNDEGITREPVYDTHSLFVTAGRSHGGVRDIPA